MSETMTLSLAEFPISDAGTVADVAQYLEQRRVADVENYLQQHRRRNINWHIILNNTTSTRPKPYGGPVVKSLKNHTKCVELSKDHWTCTLELPKLTDDNLPEFSDRIFRAETAAATMENAEHLACRAVFARLLLANPGWVVLRPCHWHVPVQQLIDDMPHGSEKHQALPVHIRAPSGDPAAAAQGLTRDEVDLRVGAILREILTSHNGRFDPSAINHKAAGLGPHDEPLYQQLHSLLHRGQLREVIERLPDISWQPRDPNSKSSAMIVTWARGSDCCGRESASDGSVFETAGVANAVASTGPEASTASMSSTIFISTSADGVMKPTGSQRLREPPEDTSDRFNRQQIQITVSMPGHAYTVSADADTPVDLSGLD